MLYAHKPEVGQIKQHTLHPHGMVHYLQFPFQRCKKVWFERIIAFASAPYSVLDIFSKHVEFLLLLFPIICMHHDDVGLSVHNRSATTTWLVATHIYLFLFSLYCPNITFIILILWFHSEIAFLFYVLCTIVFHTRSLYSFIFASHNSWAKYISSGDRRLIERNINHLRQDTVASTVGILRKLTGDH